MISVWRRLLMTFEVRRTISRMIERSACLSALNYLKGQLLYRSGLHSHGSGATHAQYSLAGSVEYIRRVVADYLTSAGVTESFLAGKRILEIGPGDNLGVALTLLAKGAAHVTCFDRFRPLTDERRNALIYRHLYETFSRQEKDRLADVIRFGDDGYIALCTNRLGCQYGVAIETWRPEANFDVVLSRAVLEHVFDLDRAWQAMTRALVPEGQMWHKVDLRHHGFFGQFHPLYFLAVSDRLWQLVSSPDPTLNRKRLPDFRRLAEESFEDYDLLVTHILDHAELVPHRRAIRESVDYHTSVLQSVRTIRRRFPKSLRCLSDAELLVTGVFLIARSPRRQRQERVSRRPSNTSDDNTRARPTLVRTIS